MLSLPVSVAVDLHVKGSAFSLPRCRDTASAACVRAHRRRPRSLRRGSIIKRRRGRLMWILVH